MPPKTPQLTFFESLRHSIAVLRYGRRAIALLWTTSWPLTFSLGTLTVLSGVLPAAIAYVGGRIVDAVVAAAQTGGTDTSRVFEFVVLEALLVFGAAAAQRGLSLCQALLRAQLGQRVSTMILEKALTLELSQFEDSEFYDKLTRARRDASTRPLSLIMRAFGLIQNGISLASYGVLLIRFSPWAVAMLLFAGLPAFLAEVKFSSDTFRLFRWRSPDRRMQMYFETLLSREDHAKEVKLFALGKRFLRRHRDIFERLYVEDKALTFRRDASGLGLSLMTVATLYGAYAWIAGSTLRGEITLGEMTMYVLLFRQGQSTVSAALSAISGMYEDNLYLSTLYEYLETPVNTVGGFAFTGPKPDDGVRFEEVGFSYPGSEQPALRHINLHLRRGMSVALVGDNGSGKTTLIKLLTRLYQPSSGRILLDGRDLKEWDETALRDRIGVIFQDFTRYQLQVGENVGAGDDTFFDDEQHWREAAAKGRADDFIRTLPGGYYTQLGTWFHDGRELSGGQWQKIALSRAFMRTRADILVLDEPTAAMDPQAEAEVFEHFRQLSRDCIAILISHRFSTVRMADQIAVLDHGTIIERGSHDELMRLGGRYAYLFTLQARGYR